MDLRNILRAANGYPSSHHATVIATPTGERAKHLDPSGGYRPPANERRAKQPEVYSSADLYKLTLTELSRQLAEYHYDPSREAMNRLCHLAEAVSRTHGPDYFELYKIKVLLQELRKDLTVHLIQVENILFPYLAQLEQALALHVLPAKPSFGSVGNKVRMFMREHEMAGELLRIIRHVSKDFVLPINASEEIRIFYRELEKFERDQHRLIEIENEVLFPRAVATESVARMTRVGN